jgi:2-polyprenyl-6-methoxyphenol hydroxylase-like FAD-dependent oxidoreductase
MSAAIASVAPRGVDVLIVGGGYAGLTLARLLAVSGRVTTTVLEQRASFQTTGPDRAVGLWDQAQDILTHRAMCLDTAAWVHARRHIRPASYRNRAGTWLSMATPNLRNSSRVATIRQSHLLALLARPVPNRMAPTGVDVAPWVSLSTHVAAMMPHSDHVLVTCSDGRQFRASVVVGTMPLGCNVCVCVCVCVCKYVLCVCLCVYVCTCLCVCVFFFLIAFTFLSLGLMCLRMVCCRSETVSSFALAGADGVDSSVRRMVFPTHRAHHTGHTTWGAVCPDMPFVADATASRFAPVAPDQAYESLGHGRRFAVVPLQRGLFWFATLPRALMPTSPVSLTNIHSRLLSLYPSSSWHASLADIITHTPITALEERSIMTAPALPAFSHGRFVLLGDAAHPMPNNLAQGAAVGIEDAYVLAHHLLSVFPPDSRTTPAVMSESVLARAFAAYYAARHPRVDRLRGISQMTELLAAPEHPVTEVIRDAVLHATPRSLNQAVFDAALDASLACDVPVWSHTIP